MTDYLAKLRDPRWQKMRLQIMQRDEFTCRNCGDMASTLHVHHRWYEGGKDPWEYGESALVTLCETCHELESDNLPGLARDLVLMMKQGGAMAQQFYQMCAAIGPAISKKPMVWREWLILSAIIAKTLQDREFDRGEWHKESELLDQEIEALYKSLENGAPLTSDPFGPIVMRRIMPGK